MSLESLPERNHHSSAASEHLFSREFTPTSGTSLPSQRGEGSNNQTNQKTHQEDLNNFEQRMVDSLSRNPNDMHVVYETLQTLNSQESTNLFKQDLTKINEDLHKLGHLPELSIVFDDNSPDHFALKPQDSAHKPEGNPSSRGSAGGDSHIPGDDRPSENPERPHHSPSSRRHGGDSGHHSGREHRHGHGEGRNHRAGNHHHGGHHSEHHHGGHHRRHQYHGGGHHGHHKFAGGAYDDVQRPDDATLENSVKAVLKEAKEQGLSEKATKAAVASMLVESQGNPEARGDRTNRKDPTTATSFGLFQLHRGGELTDALRDGRLKNEQEAFDPQKNAHVALSYFKNEDQKHNDPGALAAAAQKPKDRDEYSQKVNSQLPEAERLIRKYSGADGTPSEKTEPHPRDNSTGNNGDASPEFRGFMAQRASNIADRLHSQQHGRVGNCAAGPRQTFDPASNDPGQSTSNDSGFHLPQGLTAVEQGRIYENHPEFFRPLGPDETPAPADIGYRHWSDRAIRQDPYAHGGQHKDRGDIFTVTGADSNDTVHAANDHQFVVPPNGSHYSGDIKYFRPTRAFEEYYKSHFGTQS